MAREHGIRTIKLLQDALHSAGAAATAHSDLELVGVVRHSDGYGDVRGGKRLGKVRKVGWRGRNAGRVLMLRLALGGGVLYRDNRHTDQVSRGCASFAFVLQSGRLQ